MFRPENTFRDDITNVADIRKLGYYNITRRLENEHHGATENYSEIPRDFRESHQKCTKIHGFREILERNKFQNEFFKFIAVI